MTAPGPNEPLVLKRSYPLLSAFALGREPRTNWEASSNESL